MRGLMQDRPLLLSGLLEHGARYHGDQLVVSAGMEHGIERLSFRNLAARCRRLASALLAEGCRPGEVLGSLSWNHHRHLEVFHAVPGAGMVLHTANPRVFPEQIAYALNHGRARWLFVDPDCLELAERLAPNLEHVETWVLLGQRDHMPAETRLPDPLCYEDLLAAGDDGWSWPGFDENTASTLCFTSGTTGPPKGALYSHRGSVLQAMAVAGAGVQAYGADDVVLAPAPLFHCNGWSTPYTCPMTGARLVFPGRDLEAAHLHRLIVEEGVTFAMAVPTVWLSILELLRNRGGDLGRLERIITGGTAPPEAMMAELERDYGVRAIHAWGMTETTAMATYSHIPPGTPPDNRIAIRSRQGIPLLGSEVRIVDDEGQALPHDGVATGHLQTRGHWMAKGYFRQETVDLVDPEGWMETGDVATIDAAGAMRITDRSKDLVKSGGEWISSIDLENAAAGHPDVQEAAVIAVPHPKWQERPLLLVVPRPGTRPSAESLRAFLADKVAKWWFPDEVILVDALPHTATGKVLKTELRERYAQSRGFVHRE